MDHHYFSSNDNQIDCFRRITTIVSYFLMFNVLCFEPYFSEGDDDLDELKSQNKPKKACHGIIILIINIIVSSSNSRRIVNNHGVIWFCSFRHRSPMWFMIVPKYIWFTSLFMRAQLQSKFFTLLQNSFLHGNKISSFFSSEGNEHQLMPAIYNRFAILGFALCILPISKLKNRF